MKILVNGNFLTKPFTGIGQYTLNLLHEWALIEKNSQFIVVYSFVEGEEKLIDEKLFPENVNFYACKVSAFWPARVRRFWFEQIYILAKILRGNFDLFFNPYLGGPWFGFLFRKKTRFLMTVHDVIPWKHSQYQPSWASKFWHFMSKWSLRFVDLILTVSDFSKLEICQYLGIEDSKIFVVPNAAAAIFSGKSPNTDFDLEQTNLHRPVDVLKKFGLEIGEYLIYCGGFEVRKNLNYLAEEFKKFCDGLGNGKKLVIVGEKNLDSNLYTDLKNTEASVVFTGRIDQLTLKELYQKAFCYVSFSIDEGFNIAALEAACSGAPLVLSDIPAHREIYGTRAIMVDISLSGTGCKAFSELTESTLRENFKKLSRELGEIYSWKKSAEKFKEIVGKIHS